MFLHKGVGSKGIWSCSPIIGTFKRFNSSNLTHYQVLDLPDNATIKEVKVQFKKLSKKYHPDLNSHLPEEAKEENSTKFVKIIAAYDILKDVKRKREYDAKLRSSGAHQMSVSRKNNDWHNKYYGEAKYYSKSGSQYSASGLNTKRHKVRYANDVRDKSMFGGQHVYHGDRFDVPHFDYNQHLNKHLKFEQRIINKHLTEDDRKAILKQLAKDGDTSKLSEELITKHLMRQVHHTKNQNPARTTNNYTNNSSSSYGSYMYESPHNESDSSAFKTFALLGGAGGSLYLLYSLFK